MFRRLMASSAVAALLATGAFSLAQAQTEQPAGEQPAAADPAAGGGQGAVPADEGEQLQTQPAQPTLTPEQPTIASAFMGRSVFSSQDPQSDNIGEVNDLIIGPDGKITHAVIGVGGFLGIGEKSVAVPFAELQVAQNEGGEIRLIYAATREQLEAAQAYDATAFDPEERADQQQEAAADTAAGGEGAGAAGAGGVAPGLTPTPADTPVVGADTGAGNTDANTAAAGGNTGTPDANADAAGGNTGAPDAADQAAGQDNTTVVEQQPAPANVTDAPADTVLAPTGGGAAPEPAPAPAPAEAPATPPPGAFMNFDTNLLRASSMIGQEIYGPNNESIGEVSDLIVQEGGTTRAALIDVGGFLGIGERRVSIPFDQIKFAPPAPPPADMTAAPAAGGDAGAGAGAAGGGAAGTDPAAGGGVAGGAAGDPAAQPGPTAAAAEPVMTVALTREQIEQLPEYQDPNQQAAAGQGGGGEAGGDAGGEGGNAVLTAPLVTPEGNAPAGGAAGADPNAAGAEQQAAADAQTQFQPVTREMSADDLMGSAVYSQNEENLGEVGDVIFDPQGAIQAVVVDVGGFLGIGEKPVALQYSAVQVQQNGNGDVRILVNASQEQLQNAPAYAEDAAPGQAQGQAAQPAQ